MAIDAYTPCPCGSGKKFKWCCQPIHQEINRAFRQDQEGQHEAALRTMEEVVAQHPANPEAWGRRAQLLYENDRAEEAENSLQKAFEINPKYPFGCLLQGMFRQQEGEIAGALLLFRKAAELYDPEARDMLAQVYTMIADCEMNISRPVAARAALKISLHFRPNEELRRQFDALFGEKSQLPAAATREYTFQSPSSTSSGPERIAVWDRALQVAASGKLVDVLHAFEQLTQDIPEDASAWYNLALARAWLGDNAKGLEALNQYVALQPDEGRAAAAWALGEVLRFGQGMEDASDYVEYSVLFQLRTPQQLFGVLQEWEHEHRLTGVQVHQEQGLVTGVILERVSTLATDVPASQLPRLGAYFMVVGDIVRLWNSRADMLDKVRQELQQRAGPSIAGAQLRRGPARFADVWTEALVFPVGTTDQAEVEKRLRAHVQRHFEETWIHRPLRALDDVPPIDAAGHPVLRRKLLGVVRFIEECSAGATQAYDFDRLRRKLGLLAGESPPDAGAAGPENIEAMGVAELAALRPEALAEEQVEQACRAAQKLDAHGLATRFARNLISRPANGARADRYPWYTYLVQRALAEGNLDEALTCLDAGEKADCEHNEGRRRNDYELRRGQVLARRGETDSARDVFERLIQRAPSELRYRGSAAEAMLSAKQGAKALQFAEQGLLKAREKNDRDSEAYFMELADAARRQAK